LVGPEFAQLPASVTRQGVKIPFPIAWCTYTLAGRDNGILR